MIDYDYAMAGAGLAGLSLATAIADLNPSKSIVLIDPRNIFERDHNWCCWNNVNSKIDLPFYKQWFQWKVVFNSKSIYCKTERYPYVCIFADSFYDISRTKLNKCDQINWLLGDSLQKAEYKEQFVEIKTNSGQFSSKLLFDSRPPQFDSDGLRQDFFGFHIRCDDSVFDSDCLTLMDFSGIKVNKTPGFHFFYVLPFSKYEALVESVFVGQSRLNIDLHTRFIKDYLLKTFGVSFYDIIYTEHGCIPMHPIRKESANIRHLTIGTKGGLVRPSTGYAFAAIQRFSKQLARLLQSEEVPRAPEMLSKKAKVLDSVLLTYLKKQPYDGPFLLSSLFAAVDPDVLVRFLCDSSSLQDDAAIFAAMPKKLELGLIMAGML